MTFVLKVGGNQLDDPAFIAGMAAAVKGMPAPPVIVHGGGQRIKALQTTLGIEARYIDGLRVTDAATLEVVMMSLIGFVNPTLVAALGAAGVDALGFNGADRGLLRGEKLIHPGGDLGSVGRITAVRVEPLRQALAARVVPVIAPLMLGYDGTFYNVNADQAAGAVAAALNADRVVFLTNVPGVLDANGALLPRITRKEAAGQIAGGVIGGGMAVKVGAAFDALDAGVQAAMITDLDALRQGVGTLVVAG